MTIERRNHGRGHSYTIDGVKVPGVTTILDKTVPKPGLKKWAGEVTADYAIDYWDDLTPLRPSERRKRLYRVQYETADIAAKRGTEVHGLAEHIVKGEEVEVPDELAGHVQAYVDYLDASGLEPVIVEGVVGNRTVGYCGTLDLIADIDGTTWLIDLKTNRTGIFGETALQCCAYARAEIMASIDGEDLDMIPVERVGAIHIRADGAELYPLDTGETGDETWAKFRHLAWLYRNGFADEFPLRSLVGEAIRPGQKAAS